MQNAKIFMDVFNSIKNAKFFMGLAFFGLLRPKSKIENRYLFAKNFT
jgi:hypothetical protein